VWLDIHIYEYYSAEPDILILGRFFGISLQLKIAFEGKKL
jgi:hypothetical protein